MVVTNRTSFPVIAFISHTEVGYSDDVEILPNKSLDVDGPYVGEMGGGRCTIFFNGTVICQETPDDENGFQVTRHNPLCLGSGKMGITIRHHLDEPEDYVIKWRKSNL